MKRIRNFRKLTQAHLGRSVGLSDVRIRQYEISNRPPKEDMIQELAKALDCNYRSIYEPSLYAAEDVMYALFELDNTTPGICTRLQIPPIQLKSTSQSVLIILCWMIS
ncbi:helix-turn-helix domain-containing protein [Coprococcus sp. HCN-4056]|uniref:helix-turn-helix domain-containing protein n=1 Tax=Coprococcus sp. HCN-4056 TaxID=3134671 RepID=UPI0040400612